MSESRRNVLAIGVDAPTFDKVAPFLERSTFEVDRFPRGRTSLELISVVSFDVLLVRYPLPDMPVLDFLGELRKPGSNCLRTPVVLLTEEERMEEARYYIGKGANRALCIADTSDQLQNAVSDLLQVAPRVAVRVMASLQVKLEEGTSLAMCQTENVSATGMLVRSNVGYPPGTRLGFEFLLLGDSRAVKGEAEVVRHTTIGREAVRGVGCRFISFEEDGEKRFRDHLNRQNAAEGSS